MTNAIEQAKYDMYGALEVFKHFSSRPVLAVMFESQLESCLELLRQDHEALHETARARFEDIGKLLEANADLVQRLAKMTEERDSIQLRLHAVDHACKTQQDRASTSCQTSGDRSSCATTDAKTMVILKALMDAQRIMTDYLVPDGIRAKDAIGKLIPVLDNQKLVTAMNGFEEMAGYGTWFINNDKCMHSFFAIGDDQMKCTFCGVGK